MDFNKAIKAHSNWKLRLSAYAGIRDGTLKPEEIEADNKCALGRWIYGKGTRWARLPEYTILKTEHAVFHIAAAEVVRKINSGNNVDVEIAPRSNSTYEKTSLSVVATLVEMKRKVSI